MTTNLCIQSNIIVDTQQSCHEFFEARDVISTHSGWTLLSHVLSVKTRQERMTGGNHDNRRQSVAPLYCKAFETWNGTVYSIHLINYYYSTNYLELSFLHIKRIVKESNLTASFHFNQVFICKTLSFCCQYSYNSFF